MFVLSFLLLLWMVSVAGGCVVGWLAYVLAGRFVLKQAHLVVAGVGYHSVRVNVSQEMRELGGSPRKVQLLSFLRAKALRGDLRAALDACWGRAIEGPPHVQQAPVCFLDVQYTVRFLWVHPVHVHRCLYPIYSVRDHVQYPPTFPRLLWKRSPTLGVESAILTLRCTHGGGRSVHLSCCVTSRLRTLHGPREDFHCESTVGYQLRRHILRVVLMPDISELVNAVPDLAEHAPAAAASPEANSTDSLKSLSQRPSVSLRLQVKLATQRTEVMVL